jgi:hypothetical protein
MAVKIRIFYPALQALLEGSDEAQAEGATVGECLEDLAGRYPAARKLLFDARGRLLKPVYVFVNAESLQKADLARTVTGDDVLIVAILAIGG